MNRKEAKELLPLIQAFAEGKRIEYSTDGKSWSETETLIWDNYFVYRIKPKSKFDPKTLKPFDKVLVRDYCHQLWECILFPHRTAEYYSIVFRCGSPFLCCIPYNDETKHLVGTSDDAPECYRYWED